jgi:hypothetical protein
MGKGSLTWEFEKSHVGPTGRCLVELEDLEFCTDRRYEAVASLTYAGIRRVRGTGSAALSGRANCELIDVYRAQWHLTTLHAVFLSSRAHPDLLVQSPKSNSTIFHPHWIALRQVYASVQLKSLLHPPHLLRPLTPHHRPSLRDRPL